MTALRASQCRRIVHCVTHASENRKRNFLATGIGFLGKTLIVLGLLLLAFVGYQLWGTSLEESRAQSDLASSFSSEVQQTETSIAAPKPVIRGGAVGRIVIPKIGVDKWIVAGVDWKSLKKGPGLYPDGPLPGQRGNAAIAGHRTTFGAPFERIDELVPGDIITIETREGTFGYVVASSKVVRANDVSVLKADPSVESSITLISCWPKYTASRRIIIRANIAPDNTTPVKSATPLVESIGVSNGPLVGGWFHDAGGILPASILGAALLAIALIPRIARRRWASIPARIATVLVTSAIFLPTLYYFFQNVSRLVPTNL